MDAQTYSEKLLEITKDYKKLALEYMTARSDFARCLNRVTILIHKAGLSDDKSAFEKIIPKLFSHPEYGDEAMQVSEEMNTSRQSYKGIEQALRAYQAQISGIQSVMKWHLEGEKTKE